MNLECGHVLIISDVADLENFKDKAERITQRITGIGDSISVDELKGIFGDLNDYLVIPHYDKEPAIKGEALDQIADYVSAGEVDTRTNPVLADLFSSLQIQSRLTKTALRIYIAMMQIPPVPTEGGVTGLAGNQVKINNKLLRIA